MELTHSNLRQRGCIQPSEHRQGSRLCKKKRQGEEERKYSRAGWSGSTGGCSRGPQRHSPAAPSHWRCCRVSLECKDAKDWVPPGLRRDTPSSITSCLPEPPLLFGQSCSTWKCLLLSLPLPRVYQRLAQGIMIRTCTLSKAYLLPTCSWGKEKVPGNSIFKNHTDSNYLMLLSFPLFLNT